MMEGSVSGCVQILFGFGSGRSKNIRIQRFRIHNTASHGVFISYTCEWASVYMCFYGNYSHSAYTVPACLLTFSQTQVCVLRPTKRQTEKWSNVMGPRRKPPRVGKNPFFFFKNQPSGFFWFFWVFWVFSVFFGFYCPEERVFRCFFSVSRILLGASRL